ncbi:RNase H domain-containing protein [Trichonephila clavipes]|nr:RNase H domain-containing protein [Trichonephila clavipes]
MVWKLGGGSGVEVVTRLRFKITRSFANSPRVALECIANITLVLRLPSGHSYELVPDVISVEKLLVVMLLIDFMLLTELIAIAAASNPVDSEDHMVLTSIEIYFRAKELICRTWVVHPVRPWYFQRHPGSAISFKGSRSYQTAFSQFSTGHLSTIKLAARGQLATDPVILNDGEMSAELAPSLPTSTPHQWEDVRDSTYLTCIDLYDGPTAVPGSNS